MECCLAATGRGFHFIQSRDITILQISVSWNEKTSIEYLNHLNFALGSCGEFHSCYVSFKQADQITDDEYEQLDKLHYKVENELLRLFESMQRKQEDQCWEHSFESK
jgi:hypothetical protein